MEATEQKKKLIVILLEDSIQDTEFIKKALIGFGYSLKFDTANNEIEFSEKIKSTVYDIILSDYNIPGYSGEAALALAKNLCPEVPFIFISGTIGEDAAVELMKQGATDYVLKDKIFKLSIAVPRALKEQAERSAVKEKDLLLKESEFLFEDLYNNAPVGYHEINTEGKIVLVNQTELEMLGYTRDDMIGKFVWDFIADDKSTQGRVLQKLKGSFPTGVGLERKYRKKDDSFITLLIEDRLVKNSDGQITGIRTTLQDITEKNKMDEMLSESEERFRAILESATDAIISISKEGTILEWNRSAERIFGYSKDEIIGRGLPRVVPQRYLESHIDGIKRVIEGGERHVIGKTVELWGMRKDGTEFPLELSLSSGDISTGKFFTGIIRDITERKKAESDLIAAKEKAEEMSKVKSNFLANMSHELRTPLIGILGYSELLGEELEDEEFINMVKTIHKSGERLKTTLNMILDLSKVEANQIQLKLAKQNLAPFVQNCVDLYAVAAKESGLELVNLTKEQNVYADVDGRLITDILNNVLKNAIVYTEKGGISITVEKQEETDAKWASIIVKDTGIGIAKKDLELIFDEFRQASEGFGRSYEGTGLGLTLTKKYVMMMGGEILIESELGKGSTVIIKFPFIESVTEKKVDKIFTVEIGETISKPLDRLPCLLYVENDEVSLLVVQKLLRKICKMEFAEKGEEAIQAVAKKQYDCILMDINLGRGIDGLETTKRIRELSNYKTIPIIAVTAYAMVGDEEEFLKAGCTDYISKPFKMQEIIDVVEKSLIRS